uniref:Uncharacterized protein n=1 Tax=Tolypothrix bouteillei VB521301 TaxID=1479485 RepID=A0A0C1QXX4_9CYAN
MKIYITRLLLKLMKKLKKFLLAMQVSPQIPIPSILRARDLLSLLNGIERMAQWFVAGKLSRDGN